MPRDYQNARSKYDKIWNRHQRNVEEARIDGDAEALVRAAESLGENLIRATLEFEDQHWKLLGGEELAGGKGISHSQLKQITKQSREMTKVNALMGRAYRVKTNHVFGRGFSFDLKPAGNKGEIAPRHQKIIDDFENQRVLFSPTAMKSLNRTLWNTGNLFVLYDSKEREFSVLPVDDGLDNYITYDNNPSRIKYYRRSYTIQNDLTPDRTGNNTKTIDEWIPVLEYKEKKGASLEKSVKVGGKTEPINQDCVIIDLRVNRDGDETWGIPDCFSAIPWAWASAEYIKDGSKLLKAYASIAYQIKAKTEKAQKATGAAIANSKVAGTAVTGPETEISQVNRASAVDLYTGRPIQAMFGAAVDLSVTSVTTDTGKGGAYGSEQVLEGPELMSALSRQEDFIGFFRRIFRAMGVEGTIHFANLTVDPGHRKAQSAGTFYQFGAISQRELREIALKELDLEGDLDELPKPNEFTGTKMPEEGDEVLPGQGKSGAVGALSDGDNELRDEK